MSAPKKSSFDPHVLFDANSFDWWDRVATDLQKAVIVLSGMEKVDYEQENSLRYPCRIIYGEFPKTCPLCNDCTIRKASKPIAVGVETAFCGDQCKNRGVFSPTYIHATSVEGEFLIAEAIKFIEEHGGHVETMDPAIQSQ